MFGAGNVQLLGKFTRESKSNPPLYSLYYTEPCNELARPISASLCPGNTASFEETCNVDGSLATQCPIRPARDLNLRSLAPKTNALPLNQLADSQQKTDEFHCEINVIVVKSLDFVLTGLIQLKPSWGYLLSILVKAFGLQSKILSSVAIIIRL